MEALGSPRKAIGSSRKHLAVLGRNPREGKHWEELRSTRKHQEAQVSTQKHGEAPESIWKHQKALGSPIEVMGSTRKHLAVLGRNPKEGKYWEALRSTRKHQEALGPARNLLEAL